MSAAPNPKGLTPPPQESNGHPAQGEAIEATLDLPPTSEAGIASTRAETELEGSASQPVTLELPSGNSDHPLPPQTRLSGVFAMPGYEILGELGRGGMGVVYKARQTKLKRIVALKMILGGGHGGTAARARFRSEAEAVARIQHNGIVQVHEVGEHNGLPFFSLEFCPGGSLAEQLDGTPLEAKKGATLIRELAGAIQAAHDQGVVHRDLKPANVLLAADGSHKITDFGLAKMLDSEQDITASGAIMGTPSYMAPEQATGRLKEIGAATDVYSLGAILYELLAGRPPFKGATVLETVAQVASEEPVPPSHLQRTTPVDLETICLKCLAKSPGRRYPSALTLADDLGRWLNGDPIEARPIGKSERLVKWARRRPAAAALVAVSALAIVLLLVMSLAFNITLQKKNVALVDAADRERKFAEEAKLQRDKARDRFRLAQESVDKFYTEVSDSPEMQATGTEKLRTQLLKSAAEYYQVFVRDDESEDPTIQAERGRALSRLASLYRDIGERQKAEEADRQALAIAEALAARYPDEIAYQKDLYGSYFTIKTVESLLRALAIAKKIATQEPQAIERQELLAMTYLDLSMEYDRIHKPDRAQEARDQGLGLWEKLSKQPEKLKLSAGLSIAITQLGIQHMQAGRFEPAAKAFQEVLVLLKAEIEKSPEQHSTRTMHAVTLQSLATVYFLSGRSSLTEDLHKEQVTLHRQLAALHPAIPDLQNELATGLLALAQTYRLSRRDELAKQASEEALAVRTRLVKAHPESPTFLRDLVKPYEEIAELDCARGRFLQAKDGLEQAAGVARRLEALQPHVGEHKVGLVNTLIRLAEVSQDGQQFDMSEKTYREALTIQVQLTEGNPQVGWYHIREATIASRIGDLVRRRGAFEEGVACYTEAIQVLEAVLLTAPQEDSSLEKQKAPKAPGLGVVYRPESVSDNVRPILAASYRGRAESFVKLDFPRQAVADWDRAVELQGSQLSPALRLQRALALAYAGDHVRAMPEVRELTEGPNA